MKRLSLGLLVLLAISGWALCARYEPSPSAGRTVLPMAETLSGLAEHASHYANADGEVAVLIDLHDDASPARIAHIDEEIESAALPFEHEGLSGALNENAQLYRVMVPLSELADLRAAFADEDVLESAEIEARFQLDTEEFVTADAVDDLEPNDGGELFRPNDPYYKHQWHLDQIQMPAAWQRNQGEGVVVAVIDTGVLYRDHGRARQVPDLAGTRFVDGWDFVDGDNTPDDGHGHGTHVAGTIAQTTNNGVGVAGVAPNAQIMPIRVLDNRGGGRYGNVAAGIRWAVDNGAKVLNLSLGGPVPSAAISNAIRYAHAKGAVVVVAAGNTGRGRVQFPGAARHAFAVGAVRFDESLSFYSSFGRHLDIVAPGGDLRVDQNRDGLPDGVLQNTMVPRRPDRNDYLGFQGTSMAAPHIAGVAALLVSSGITDPNAVERIIQETAKQKSDRSRYGAGLVQANDALIAATRNRDLSGGAFALLVALGALGLRRRRVAKGEALAAGGLGVLVSFGAATLAPLLGAFWPIVLSALVPFALVAFGLHRRAGRVLAAGAGVGLAGWSVFEALSPSLASVGGMATGPWLVISAALSAGLAIAALRRSDA